MLRCSLAVVVALAASSQAVAGPHVGVITSLTSDEVVILVRKDPKDKKSDFTEKKTFKVNKETLYYFGPESKGDEPEKTTLGSAREAVKKAVKAFENKKAPVEGHFARIETESDAGPVVKVYLLGKAGR